MPFQVSPGVNVSEIDLTASAPAVSTSDGAMVGQFSWGPSNVIQNISSETELVSVFGKPNATNYKSWFTAANFLAYSNSLKVVRALGTGALNAISGTKVSSSALDGQNTESGVDATNAIPFTGDAAVTQVSDGDGTTTVFTITDPADMTDRTATVSVDGNTLTDGVGFVRTGNSIDFAAGTSPHGAPQAVAGNVVITIAARTQFTLSRDTYESDVVVRIDTVVQDASTYSSTGAVLTFNAAPADGASIEVDIPARTKFVVTETIETTDSLTVKLDNVTLALTTDYTVSGQTVTFVSAPTSGQTVTLQVFSAAVESFQYGTLATPIGNEDDLSVHDTGQGGDAVFGARCAGKRGNNLRVYLVDSATFSELPQAYQNLFDAAPGTNELHVIVEENVAIGDGGFQWNVVETHSFLSKAGNGKRADGTNVYYVDVIREQSSFIWPLNHPEDLAWGTDVANGDAALPSLSEMYYSPMSGGNDGVTPTVGTVSSAFDLFADSETTDVSLLLLGEWGEFGGNADNRNTILAHLISIVESRKDCVAILSASWASVQSKNASNVISSFNDLSSNYAFADSNWKYQYDKYNDVYRWVPMNGDVAGLMARTDSERDAWFSPAGFNRGIIKNVVKLAWAQNKTDRDDLYKKAINPVVTFPGQGTVLFGDKTLTTKPSAFDRINVRRLFIVLEKSIAAASKFTLFEFNDEFTRSQFVSLVEPFLRDVKGRRGIYDFLVVCDETNNTAGVIDRNEFVGDIFIKPARSINFIQLNFVAVRSGVAFEEIIGTV